MFDIKQLRKLFAVEDKGEKKNSGSGEIMEENNSKKKNIDQIITSIQEKLEKTEHQQMMKKKYSNLFFFITILIVIVVVLFAIFFFILPNTSNGNVSNITNDDLVKIIFTEGLLSKNSVKYILDINPVISGHI